MNAYGFIQNLVKDVEKTENARNCVLQDGQSFKFSAQTSGVYRLIIVKVPEKVPLATYLIEAKSKGKIFRRVK